MGRGKAATNTPTYRLHRYAPEISVLQHPGSHLRQVCTLETRSLDPQLESRAVFMYSIKNLKGKSHLTLMSETRLASAVSNRP